MEFRYSLLEISCQQKAPGLIYPIGTWDSIGVLPLNSPVHGGVGNDEGGRNVKDLVTEATEDVEDGSVSGTGQGTLAVGGEGVAGNALGGRAAYWCSSQFLFSNSCCQVRSGRKIDSCMSNREQEGSRGRVRV